MYIFLAILLGLAVLALWAVAISLAWFASMVREGALPMLGTLAERAVHDEGEPAQWRKDLSELNSRVNDLDERSERRYRMMAARARRAAGAEVDQEEDEEAEAERLAASLMQQPTREPSPVPNGRRLPPPPQRRR